MVKLNELKKELFAITDSELNSVCGGESFKTLFPLSTPNPSPAPPLPSLIVSPSVSFNTINPQVGTTYGLGLTNPASGISLSGSYNPTSKDYSVGVNISTRW